MAYYDALVAVWNTTTLPTGVIIGTPLTSDMTAQQKLDAINGWQLAGPSKPVARGEVRQHFDNMVNASGVPVWELIEAHQTEQSALGIACRGAIRLRDAPGDYPAIDLTSPLFQAQTTSLQAAGILTADQLASTSALGATVVYWWQANGASQPIGTADLTLAGGLS